MTGFRTTYSLKVGDHYSDTIGANYAPMWGAVGLNMLELTGRADTAAWVLNSAIAEMVRTPLRYASREAYGLVLAFLIYLRAACEKQADARVKVTFG